MSAPSEPAWVIEPIDDQARADALAGALEERVVAFNTKTTGYRDGRTLSYAVHDESGQLVAGLDGFTWGGYPRVEWLWVHEARRRSGLGAALMAAAEAEVLARGFLSRQRQVIRPNRKLPNRARGRTAAGPEPHDLACNRAPAAYTAAPVLPFTPRAVCYRCFKPQVMCICRHVSRVDNRTGLFVLQHPRERLHPIGTARLANLGLNKVRVEVAWNAGVVEHARPAWLPEGTALLYPAPNARDLCDLAPDEQPRHLLVLDGTWHTAGTLYRDKTWLKQLPHVRFSPSAPSRYRLRLEPERDYVSTIEAIVEALRVLEPETHGLDGLLSAFDSMIDQQMEHVLRRAGDRQKRTRRPEAHRRLPEALVSGLQRIVVVYAESVRIDRERRA